MLAPIMDIQGHYVSPEPNTGCWLWTGPIKYTGYGRFSIKLDTGEWKTVVAHRYAFEAERGNIPVGMCLDHICRVRCCVNPWHLDPVTPQENTRLGYLARRGISGRAVNMNECINGHPYPLNLGQNGHCLACGRLSASRAEALAARRIRDKANYRAKKVGMLNPSPVVVDSFRIADHAREIVG